MLTELCHWISVFLLFIYFGLMFFFNYMTITDLQGKCFHLVVMKESPTRLLHGSLKPFHYKIMNTKKIKSAKKD